MPNQSLRDRAAGTEVARHDGDDLPMAQQIQRMEDQFQLAMPRGIEAKQLVRDAMTALRTTPKLAEADPKTVLGALMTCAQLGLRPGVLGHAWVLPFWDNRSRTQKAQLVIGYQGLVELAHRSGKIASLIARTVHENDPVWDVQYGLHDDLKHTPLLEGDRGAVIAYYAIVKLNTGGYAFQVMSRAEAEAHRDRHAMAKNREGTIVGPWRDHFDQMALKTCVLKLAKWMPKGTDLAIAMAADEGVRVDLAPDVSAETATHQFGGRDDDVAEALRKQCYDAGSAVGLDGWAVESKFAEGSDGTSLADASVEQLQSFHAHLLEQQGEEPQEPADA